MENENKVNVSAQDISEKDGDIERIKVTSYSRVILWMFLFVLLGGTALAVGFYSGKSDIGCSFLIIEAGVIALSLLVSLAYFIAIGQERIMKNQIEKAKISRKEK